MIIAGATIDNQVGDDRCSDVSCVDFIVSIECIETYVVGRFEPKDIDDDMAQQPAGGVDTATELLISQ